MSDWEYCECGCHGHVILVGAKSYWLSNDLKGYKDSFRLYLGHGPYRKIGSFSSFDEASAAVLERAEQALKDLQNTIDALKERQFSFCVFDTNKPATLYNNKSWDQYIFRSFSSAKAYALKWVGRYSESIPADWDGSPIVYSGAGDDIEIRKVKRVD